MKDFMFTWMVNKPLKMAKKELRVKVWHAAAVFSLGGALAAYIYYKKSSEVKRLKQLSVLDEYLFKKEELNLVCEKKENKESPEKFNRFIAFITCAVDSSLSFNLTPVLLRHARLVLHKLILFSAQEKAKLLVYKGYGRHTSINNYHRYQLGLFLADIGSDNKLSDFKYLEAHLHYAAVMGYLIDELKVPRAALFFQQLVLRLIAKTPGFLEALYRLTVMTPDNSDIRSDQRAQEDDKQVGQYTCGEYFGSKDFFPSVSLIRKILLSGHSSIFFECFYLVDGTDEIKGVEATSFPLLAIQGGWLQDDRKPADIKTSADVFNRHSERMPRRGVGKYYYVTLSNIRENKTGQSAALQGLQTTIESDFKRMTLRS